MSFAERQTLRLIEEPMELETGAQVEASSWVKAYRDLSSKISWHTDVRVLEFVDQLWEIEVRRSRTRRKSRASVGTPSDLRPEPLPSTTTSPTLPIAIDIEGNLRASN